MANGKKSHRPSQIQKADTSMPSPKLSLRMKSSCTGDLAIKICGVLPNGTLRHHQVQTPGSTENRIYLVRKILNSRLFVSFTKFSLSFSLPCVSKMVSWATLGFSNATPPCLPVLALGERYRDRPVPSNHPSVACMPWRRLAMGSLCMVVLPVATCLAILGFFP